MARDRGAVRRSTGWVGVDGDRPETGARPAAGRECRPAAARVGLVDGVQVEEAAGDAEHVALASPPIDAVIRVPRQRVLLGDVAVVAERAVEADAERRRMRAVVVLRPRVDAILARAETVLDPRTVAPLG